MANNIVSTNSAKEIGQAVVEFLTDTGYDEGEILGGLVWAIKKVAKATKAEEQVKDEVVALLD